MRFSRCRAKRFRPIANGGREGSRRDRPNLDGFKIKTATNEAGDNNNDKEISCLTVTYCANSIFRT
ncbi:hypothetical protein BVI2075_270014 [Burkholderia vietnamiensis]|nr:hypothetical protein BVI2075_270014 [Burkholderia vietnamiensis]